MDAVDAARKAQVQWATTTIQERLVVMRRARHLLAKKGRELAQSVGPRPGRSEADTLAAEILPICDALKYLERHAYSLLKPKRLGSRGRPAWLMKGYAEIRREPLGVVLVIAPGNYPLMLAGIQAAQGFVAGNAVLWKPAPGCREPGVAFEKLMREAGLPKDLLIVLDETTEAAKSAIAGGINKVVLTGSAETGKRVLADLAGRLIPATLELSGCDAVFVLPGADLDLVSRALLFGLRMNAGATCIAPRRVFVTESAANDLEGRLRAGSAGMKPIAMPTGPAKKVAGLVHAAVEAGAKPLTEKLPEKEPVGAEAEFPPVILSQARPEMDLLKADLMAPVLSLVRVKDAEDALAQAARCNYALGASIFGPVADVEALSHRVRAGFVTLNDLIVPLADPRLPFGGTDQSGYGSTRGAEGLLDLTAPKVVTRTPGKFRPVYDEFQPEDAALFESYLQAAHGEGLFTRMGAMWDVARKLLKRKPPAPPKK